MPSHRLFGETRAHSNEQAQRAAEAFVPGRVMQALDGRTQNGDRQRVREYAPALERWYAHFARERILVLASEEYYADPQTALNQAQDFLGLPRELLSSGEVRNRVDDIPIDDCRSDHRAQDHRQDGAQGGAPVTGPKRLSRPGVGRQVTRVVGHVRRVAELPERSHGHHGEEAHGRE